MKLGLWGKGNLPFQQQFTLKPAVGMHPTISYKVKGLVQSNIIN